MTPHAVPDLPNDVAVPIRVTLVGADELTARGLGSMLREHPDEIELVSLSRPRTRPIDIALYDHSARGPGGRPTLAELAADPSIRKIVLYTWSFQPWNATNLFHQGASAYLSKDMTKAELVQALRTVHAGRALTASRLRSTHTTRSFEAEHGQTLTEREAEVLSLICRGFSNTEVAHALHVSVNTVKSYVRACYRKIEVDSRSKAVLWGLSRGYGDSALDASPAAAASSTA